MDRRDLAERQDAGFLLLERAGRVAFTFLLMNYSAVVALARLLTHKKIWR